MVSNISSCWVLLVINAILVVTGTISSIFKLNSNTKAHFLTKSWWRVDRICEKLSGRIVRFWLPKKVQQVRSLVHTDHHYHNRQVTSDVFKLKIKLFKTLGVRISLRLSSSLAWKDFELKRIITSLIQIWYSYPRDTGIAGLKTTLLLLSMLSSTEFLLFIFSCPKYHTSCNSDLLKLEDVCTVKHQKVSGHLYTTTC